MDTLKQQAINMNQLQDIAEAKDMSMTKQEHIMELPWQSGPSKLSSGFVDRTCQAENMEVTTETRPLIQAKKLASPRKDGKLRDKSCQALTQNSRFISSPGEFTSP